MSNFIFFQPECPSLHEAASKVESLVYIDPRTACFYARRALEAAMTWLYKYDAKLKLPYQDNLSALIHEPSGQAARRRSGWRSFPPGRNTFWSRRTANGASCRG